MDGQPSSCLDIQGLDYVKPKDAPLPIVGLPIGAGPEAPEYFQHMGSFDTCALNPHNKHKESTSQAEITPSKPEPEKTPTKEVTNIVATLLAEAKDTPETQLFRVRHKSSSL